MIGALVFAAAVATSGTSAGINRITLQLEPLPPCEEWAQPEGWRDASNAFVFAAHPTAWHDQQELAAANMPSLVSFVFLGPHPRFLLLGFPGPLPAALTLRYSGAHTGWTLRWPHCGS